jgi:hypothetical protein
VESAANAADDVRFERASCLPEVETSLYSAGGMGMKLSSEAIADPGKYLAHNEKLSLFDGVCLHTPGHSAGSCSFYFKPLNLVCSGDTLFRLNIGRTGATAWSPALLAQIRRRVPCCAADLPGGNFATIKQSLQNILYKLPDSTVSFARSRQLGLLTCRSSVFNVHADCVPWSGPFDCRLLFLGTTSRRRSAMRRRTTRR